MAITTYEIIGNQIFEESEIEENISPIGDHRLTLISLSVSNISSPLVLFNIVR